MTPATTTEQHAIYELWPKQQEAMRLLGLVDDWQHAANPVEELLFGGQAGGGKSRLLRAVAATLATIWPGATIALFRRNYTRLEDTHIRAIQAEIPTDVATYNSSRHELRFHETGSVILFRHCDDEGAVYNYMSAEWDALLVDEATEFTHYQITTLRSRVRSPIGKIPGWRRIIVYTANPGNVSHGYFRDGFVYAAPEGRPFRAPVDDGGLMRCFLRSKLRDNPALGKDYRQVLKGIADPDLRRAMEEGDWNIFAGQYFRIWRDDRHTCDWFEIPAHWTQRRVVVDWGFGAPWCTLFFVRDEDLWRDQRLARWYCYREFYEAEVRDEDQGDRIAAAVQQDMKLWNEQVARLREAKETLPGTTARYVTVADPSMWNRQANGTSIAETYKQKGVQLEKANNDRIPGWQRLYSYLADQDDGWPALIFMRETCPNAIRTIPALIRDKHRVEDVNTEGEDHAGDCARMFCMSVDPLKRRHEGPPRHAITVHTGPPPEPPARERGRFLEERRRTHPPGGRRAINVHVGH